MTIPLFQLERYFALHEFSARWLLSPSDPESIGQASLLAMADPETQRLWAELRLGYTESLGHPLLRGEIARSYAGLDAGDILVAAPEEAIYLLMHSLLRQGDHVIVTQPAYQSLHEIARSLGCEVSDWRVQLEEGRWRVDLDALARQIRPTTRLIVVNFPHNPTGFLPDRATFDELLELARWRGLHLFCDEMYRGLEHEPARQLPAAADLYEKAVSLSGLSKAYALPGLRIGWLATRDAALLGRCANLKDYISICSSAPSEVLAIIALRAGARILARNRSIIADNLRAAQGFCAVHDRCCRWIPPLAGSTAFPRLCDELPVQRFADELLAQRGVMVAPGALFGDPGNHFRLGLGRRSLPGALEQVGEYLGGLEL